jgi:hypothetical protein
MHFLNYEIETYFKKKIMVKIKARTTTLFIFTNNKTPNIAKTERDNTASDVVKSVKQFL